MSYTDTELEAMATAYDNGIPSDQLDGAVNTPGPLAWLLDVVDDWDASTPRTRPPLPRLPHASFLGKTARRLAAELPHGGWWDTAYRDSPYGAGEPYIAYGISHPVSRQATRLPGELSSGG